MSLNRYARKVDNNHTEIVQALLQQGWSVQVVSSPGCPDLVVGAMNLVNVWLELKSENGKLTGPQKVWHACWKGPKPYVVNSVDGAIAAVRAEIALVRGQP